MTMRPSLTLIWRIVPSTVFVVALVVGRTSVGVETDVGERVSPTPVGDAGTLRPRSVTVSAVTMPLARLEPRTSMRSPRRTFEKPFVPTKISGLLLMTVPKPRYCVVTASVSTVMRDPGLLSDSTCNWFCPESTSITEPTSAFVPYDGLFCAKEDTADNTRIAKTAEIRRFRVIKPPFRELQAQTARLAGTAGTASCPRLSHDDRPRNAQCRFLYLSETIFPAITLRFTARSSPMKIRPARRSTREAARPVRIESSGVPCGSMTMKSADLPGSRLPVSSSRRSARAPPSVARYQRWNGLSETFCTCCTLYASAMALNIDGVVPAPMSLPSPTCTPESSTRNKGKRPLPRKRFEFGQWEMRAPRAARRCSSSAVSHTPCASTVFSSSNP